MTSPFGWIEMSNQAQLEWIGEHLKRKSLTSSALFFSVKHHAEHGYREMAKSLKALPDEAEYREASRQMKGAWYTRQYRKKHGNPVSLQMPAVSMKQLKALANKRKQSQVQTLSQIISGAGDEQKKIEGQEVRKQEPFSGTGEDAQQREQPLYPGVESKLLDFLADEIDRRCSLEVFKKNTLYPSTSSELDKTYLDLVERRLLELEPDIGDSGLTLRRRMEEKAKYNSLVYLNEDIPDDII
ncbi:hypothetical protein [Vreelandella sp. V005]|uniref:hypothetical protein n=1 Tax=Vreelandella sp. V005 TaxID=3459608 RepID=UPI004044130B